MNFPIKTPGDLLFVILLVLPVMSLCKDSLREGPFHGMPDRVESHRIFP